MGLTKTYDTVKMVSGHQKERVNMYPFYIKIGNFHKSYHYRKEIFLMKAVQKILALNAGIYYNNSNQKKLKQITNRIMIQVEKEYPDGIMSHRQFVNLVVRDYLITETYSPR